MINNVVLVGRLTKDPDLLYTANGKAVASYTLAINRNFTNQSGDREADFVNCVIWGNRAESLANYAKKGTLIGTTGRIQTRNYENQQGVRVYVTEVIAENYSLLESKGVSEAREHAHHGQPQNVGNGQQNQAQAQQNTADKMPQNMPEFPPQENPFSGSSIDIGDDDLPF